MKSDSLRSRERIVRCVIAIWSICEVVSLPPSAQGQCDPSTLGKLIGNDTVADDYLGYRVALDGDTALVGALYDDHAGGNDAGSAYVFIRVGGEWFQQAKLVANDGAAHDNFGSAVALSADTAVIGAPYDSPAGTSSGSAYVFVRNGTVWTQQAKLTPADGAANDNFGNSVAVSGNTAVVGCARDDNATGSAYVFTRSGTVWSQQAKLTASDATGVDFFGWSVALDGDTLLVGSQEDDNAGGTDAGSAYVFARSGTVWSQQAKLTANDGSAYALFGASVALSGNSALVGAYYADTPETADIGAAYVFVRSCAGAPLWTQQAKLNASDPGQFDLFGASVALHGDTAVVGAPSDDHAGGVDAGSAYVFVRFNGNYWLQQSKLIASDAAAGDYFGVSVAVHNQAALIGASNDDHAGGINAGSAYEFQAIACDTDGDGIPNVEDACPNNNANLPVDCTGRPLRDCNNDCVLDGLDIQCITNELLNQ